MLALGAALGVALTGCDDDFLTTIPRDRISDETYWRTEQDFTYAINAAYREMTAWNTIYYDNPSDLAYSQQYWAQLSDVARGLTDAQVGPHNGFWSNTYEGLAKVNEVLARLDQVEPGILSDAAHDRIEGQARFLRGYYYHELLWRFGGVPLVTQVLTPSAAREVTRASRDEIYAFVMSELEAAASLLPDLWPTGDYGRATRGAALAYQARTALYEAGYREYGANNAAGAQALYQTAATRAKAVMDMGIYDLHPDFRELFTRAGEGSAEVIFDYQHMTGQNGADYWYHFAHISQGGTEVALSGTRALVDKFYMTDGLLPEDSPLYDEAPPVITYVGGEAVLQSLGQYANRDPRFYATLLFPGAENWDGSVFNSYPPCSGSAPDGYCSNEAEAWEPGAFYNTPTGYLPRKYLDPADQGNPQDSPINFIKMRYGDVLLMYAEAKIELGELDATVNGAINAIRDRVAMPRVDVTGMSQDEAMALVRNERAVELAFEGLRYADLRRWRSAHEVMPGYAYGIDADLTGNGTFEPIRSDVQRVFTAPRDYLWPIPATERDLNAGLEQNPGY